MPLSFPTFSFPKSLFTAFITGRFIYNVRKKKLVSSVYNVNIVLWYMLSGNNESVTFHISNIKMTKRYERKKLMLSYMSTADPHCFTSFIPKHIK